MAWNAEADVVIVGGGGSGLAAAVEAAGCGAQVVVLEKNAALGGTTALAIGSFTAAGTSMQRHAGIDDSPQAHDEDVAKFAPLMEARNNAPLRRFYLEQVAATFEWLRARGVTFRGPSPEPPNRVARMHNVLPDARRGYIAALSVEADRLGVRLLTGRRASRLLLAPSSSHSHSGEDAVIGVEAQRNGEGGEAVVETYAARGGVILAAGDYSSSQALLARHLPRFAHVEAINPTATGDGHLLAMEVGATGVNMDITDGPQTRFILSQVAAEEESTSVPNADATERELTSAMGATWLRPEPALFEAGAILLNAEGVRFADELVHPDIEAAIARQPCKQAFVLFDHKVAGTFSAWPHFVCTAPKIAYAYVADLKRYRPDLYAEGRSLQAIAAHLGCHADALRTTLKSYNDAVDGRAEDACGRRSFGVPLNTPPYYCLGPAKGMLTVTKGGLRIDTSMQVLREDGTVIGGLYAAGNTGMGGIYFAGHGLSIAWAITSGRLAGRQAAQRKSG